MTGENKSPPGPRLQHLLSPSQTLPVEAKLVCQGTRGGAATSVHRPESGSAHYPGPLFLAASEPPRVQTPSSQRDTSGGSSENLSRRRSKLQIFCLKVRELPEPPGSITTLMTATWRRMLCPRDDETWDLNPRQSDCCEVRPFGRQSIAAEMKHKFLF